MTTAPPQGNVSQSFGQNPGGSQVNYQMMQGRERRYRVVNA